MVGGIRREQADTKDHPQVAADLVVLNISASFNKRRRRNKEKMFERAKGILSVLRMSENGSLLH